ncbi:MAG: ATP-binding protein [Eubacteriaceae bacterium]|nr:ATP-binding protein [Eubacteriaceae bacterium]
MSGILEMTVPGNPEYIKIAKMAAGAAASLEGFDIEKVDDIKMAVGEACKAITCHGFEGWSENYQLAMDMAGKVLTIEVEDKLCKHQVSKGTRPCMDCPGEGDLGIQIIKSLMDDVEIVKAGDGCRSIRMVKNK